MIKIFILVLENYNKFLYHFKDIIKINNYFYFNFLIIMYIIWY